FPVVLIAAVFIDFAVGNPLPVADPPPLAVPHPRKEVVEGVAVSVTVVAVFDSVRDAEALEVLFRLVPERFDFIVAPGQRLDDLLFALIVGVVGVGELSSLGGVLLTIPVRGETVVHGRPFWAITTHVGSAS